MASAAWAPPPKPGLIPLRPLDLGTLLGASFRVIRRNPRPTFGVALLVQLIATVIPFALGAFGVGFALARVDQATTSDHGAILAGAVGLGVVSALGAVVLAIVANAWLQGIIVLEVARSSVGEKLTLRQLWQRARGRMGALLGWSLIVAAALIIAIALIAGVITVLVVSLGPLGIGLGILVGILGGLGLLVLGVWIGVKVALVPSALMLERLSLAASIRRSWHLTNQAFWRTFGILILVWFILSLASGIITTPFSILAPLLLTLLDPNATGSGIGIGAAVAVYGVQLLVTVVIGAISAVIQSASTALIYLDLRMRKEGLDLTLTKYVEARQTGSLDLADPYHQPDAAYGA